MHRPTDKHNRKHSVTLFNLHTLLLIRNKSSDLLLLLRNYSLIPWHTITQRRAQVVRGCKRFWYLCFKTSREENQDSHKYAIAKGTRIDWSFVDYSISGKVAWWNTRNFEFCSIKQQFRREQLNVTMHVQSHHPMSSSWQPQREAEIMMHAFSNLNW